MKRKLIKAALIFLGILLAIVLYLLATFWDSIQLVISEHHERQVLIGQKIYAAEFPHYYTQIDFLRITYMICEPENSQEKLKTQIDQFLQEKDIVSTLLEENKSKGKISILTLYFIQPTDFMPAGEMADELDESLPFDDKMRLCKITIDWAAGGTYQYEFFPENFEAKEQ